MTGRINSVPDYDLSEGMATDHQSAHDRGTGNKNLSDILDQIMDDGPALSQRQTAESPADNLLKFQSSRKSEGDTVVRKDKGASAHESYEEIQRAAAESYAHINSLKEGRSGNGKVTTLLQWLAILFIAGMAAFSIYHADLKTEQLQRALHTISSSQEGIKYSSEPAAVIGKHSTGSASGIDDTRAKLVDEKKNDRIVAELNAEISQLKSKLQVANDRIDELDVKDIKLPVRDMNDNIIQPLGMDEKRVEENPMTKKQDDQEGVQVAANKRSTAPLAVVGRWKVNLASFTDRKKAESIYKRLQADSVNPTLETAEIDGRQRYRLTVGGFASRSDAASFANKVNRRYGLSGAWIRQVQG